MTLAVISHARKIFSRFRLFVAIILLFEMLEKYLC
jgi:hypothetical protein